MANAGRGSNTGGPRTLRRTLAAAGVLLVVVVAAFLVAGKLRAKSWVQGLPGRLGVGITQDANGFTIDQSSKGKKIFTLHAAREIQRSNGKVSLQDVGIVLYGPDGQPLNKVHGADFTYDQNAQVLTARGEVFIDLAPPPSKDAMGAPVSLAPDDLERRMVHVKTIGLVFDRKQQLASSDGPVEFRTNGYNGNSVGAVYDSKSDVILLKSQVRLSGIRDDRPVALTATRAQMDRRANFIDLQAAHYTSAGIRGAETATANHAVIHTDTAGNPQKIDAGGDVTLTSDGRGTVVTDKLDLDLGDKGQARAAHLYGKVKYVREDGEKRENGRADDARISFDAAGRPVRALMNGKVTFREQGPASLRDLASPTLDVTLSGGGKVPTMVQSAEAFGPGGATLKLVDENDKGRNSTEIKADTLSGGFAPYGRTTQLTGLNGTGHSWLHRVVNAPNGTEKSNDTSTGNLLHMDFETGDKGRSELARVEQKGNATTVHVALQPRVGKPDEVTVEHTRADDAVYEAHTNVARLLGNVEVQDELSALTADKVDMNQATGDAFAYGAVKVTYLEPPPTSPRAAASPEPVHVLADRAVAHKAFGLAEFFGSGNQMARMWQGTSQVEAPVLDLYQMKNRDRKLVAHAEPGPGSANKDVPVVRAVLISAGGSETKEKKQGSGGIKHIVSRQMVYTESAQTVEFTGAVRVVEQNGVLRANQATVWLTSNAASPSAPDAGTTPAGFMGGHVDRMTATGDVTIDQPGRRGTGDKLVYTASDQVYVLTGTKEAPPKMVDQAQGTTTGAALRFNARKGDESVEVLGSLDRKTAGRVRSETRMNQ